jgi:hypothetical protein
VSTWFLDHFIQFWNVLFFLQESAHEEVDIDFTLAAPTKQVEEVETEITLPAPPKFVKGIETQELPEGATAEFTVEVDGSPIPDVTW